MFDAIAHFFQTQGFMPHGLCLAWKPGILWTTVISHATIALSYFVIPLALIYLILKRHDFKFKWIFVLFGAFILFCGLTHLLALITLWHPIYGIQSIVLASTAMVSILTAILVWPQIPILLKIATPWQLEKINHELEQSNQELIAAENRARSIIEAAPDAMIMIDHTRRITMINTQCKHLFQYTEAELIGQPIEILMPERYRQSHPAHVNNFLTKPSIRPMGSNLDLHAIRKDGKEFPVEISLSPLITDTNTFGIAAIRDVSDKRRIEEKIEHARELEILNTALKKRTEALLRSNEELDSFSQIASHDLKEPLRGIHTFSQILLDDYHDKFDKEGMEILSTLPKLSKQLYELLSALFEYSRLGQVDMAYQEVDLQKLVDEVTLSLAPLIKLHHVTISIPHVLPSLYCDKIRIAEVFRNLISNAIKYNDNDHRTIEITVTEPKNTICIKDNGIGIPAKHHKKIFQIFKRLHAQDAYLGGTGAGLTIVKKIIEQHGGSISVESEPNKGSAFYFTLPGEKNP